MNYTKCFNLCEIFTTSFKRKQRVLYCGQMFNIGSSHGMNVKQLIFV